MVPADPRGQRIRQGGVRQPRPAGRRSSRTRIDPGRARSTARRQRDPPRGLRLPHRPAEDERRRQGGPHQAGRGPGHEAQRGHAAGPPVRRQDAAAVLERLALPADPHHRRGHAPPGHADPRALRGLPRHHRRARGPAPLPVARQGQHRPGPRLPRPSPTTRSSRPRTPTRPTCAPTRSAATAWSASTTRHCAARRASPATRSTTSGGSSARPRRTPPNPVPASSPASTPASSASPNTN